jgi:putative alpha-1,2-mannosidase
MIKRRLLLLAILAMTVQVLYASFGKQRDLTQYVSTLQGTHSNFGLSHGNTFPATAMPYAVHMWTPQTGPNGEGFKYN